MCIVGIFFIASPTKESVNERVMITQSFSSVQPLSLFTPERLMTLSSSCDLFAAHGVYLLWF